MTEKWKSKQKQNYVAHLKHDGNAVTIRVFNTGLEPTEDTKKVLEEIGEKIKGRMVLLRVVEHEDPHERENLVIARMKSIKLDTDHEKI